MKVKYCSKCVISNLRPSSTVEFGKESAYQNEYIKFDAEGVCSACRYHEAKASKIDWAERFAQLEQLCDEFRSKDGSYDCIVPGSGGKDSAFTSHFLKYKMKMNPLTVTWAPHLYTDIGFQNHQNWCHVGGLDNILVTPNGRLHREMTYQAFKNLLHPFQPFIHGQRIVGPKFADKFGISLIFYGENQAEYGNNIEDNDHPVMKSDFFVTSEPEDLLFGGVSKQDYTDLGYSESDFSLYLGVDSDRVHELGMNVHYLGYYVKWDPQEMYYYAIDHTGFEANVERTQGSYSKYSSIDDKIDIFHYFTTLIKFGLGRASYDAAQEIRNSKITRSEGVELVRLYDQEFPSKYFPDFLQYLGITEKEFWDIIEKHRNQNIWEKNADEGWVLKSPIWDGVN